MGESAMSLPRRPIPKAVAVGLCLALLSVLFGFLLGGAFGAVESSIKQQLDDSGTAVLASVYHGDVEAKNAVVSKSWAYLQRAHLHGGAVGTAACAAIAILILLSPLGWLEQISALAFGSGSLLYALFWLLAGWAAPRLGSTGLAKESLAFVALPGAGLCLLG